MLPRAQSHDLRTSSIEVKEDFNEQPKDLTGRFGNVHPDDPPIIFTNTFTYQEHDLRDWPSMGAVPPRTRKRDVVLIFSAGKSGELKRVPTKKKGTFAGGFYRPRLAANWS